MCIVETLRLTKNLHGGWTEFIYIQSTETELQHSLSNQSILVRQGSLRLMTSVPVRRRYLWRRVSSYVLKPGSRHRNWIVYAHELDGKMPRVNPLYMFLPGKTESILSLLPVIGPIYYWRNTMKWNQHTESWTLHFATKTELCTECWVQ